MLKKGLSLFLVGFMFLSLAACSSSAKVESTTAKVEEASNLTWEEKWKQEPFYGKTITYWIQDPCQSGPRVADLLGYFKDEGLTVEGLKGKSYTEPLGTNKCQVAVGHIATLMVPSTNGVDLSFVGGAHHGCKSLYALADGKFTTTESWKGQKVAVPNGIGASDYNITACLIDADGIDPIKEVELVQVENGACVQAMENGEIAAALLGDGFAYNMVKEGKLVRVRSLLDDDFKNQTCCVIAMNTTFVKENPITARKVLDAINRAHDYMREKPEESVNMLIEDGIMTGGFEKNFAVHSSLNFGITENDNEKSLRDYYVPTYIRLGLLTKTKDVNEVMNKIWTPIPNYK